VNWGGGRCKRVLTKRLQGGKDFVEGGGRGEGTKIPDQGNHRGRGLFLVKKNWKVSDFTGEMGGRKRNFSPTHAKNRNEGNQTTRRGIGEGSDLSTKATPNPKKTPPNQTPPNPPPKKKKTKQPPILKQKKKGTIPQRDKRKKEQNEEGRKNAESEPSQLLVCADGAPDKNWGGGNNGILQGLVSDSISLKKPGGERRKKKSLDP